MTNYIEKIERKTLPVVPLRGVVLFPTFTTSLELTGSAAQSALDAAAKYDGMAFFVMQKDFEDNPGADSLCTVGTVGKIKQAVKVGGNVRRVIVDGLNRASANDYTIRDSLITADLLIKFTHSGDNGSLRGEAFMREAVEAYERVIRFAPKVTSELTTAVKSITSISRLADFIACHVLTKPEDKQTVLEDFDPVKRIQTVTLLLYKEEQLLSVEAEIRQKVQKRMGEQQREAILREHLRTIRDELGDDESEIDEYRQKIADAKLPEEVEAKLNKELKRLEKTPFNSAEGSVYRNYLDTCLELPWSKLSRDRLDIRRAAKILDEDHDGLEKVKERVLEYLAVRALTPDIKTQILCLYGPPGVGKTSIGASIARALGRKYVRVSLGGVRDESDIRGHRKTYIGAMPGRITAALSQAGTRNPVILLDEIDKLGQSHNGDPASALLEVLDPEQNKAFRDHYLELPLDLSEVMFIATANTLDTVPRPLIDRMEVIEMKTYTRHEKLSIAKHHLILKQSKACGLNKGSAAERKNLRFTDGAILEIVDYYTHEAGVRNLERQIASVCRKAARKFVENPELRTLRVDAADVKEYLGARKRLPDAIADENEVGVVNGLAFTQVGGDMLKVEVAVLEGNGKLELTGSLGDVMKESAHIAVSFVRSRAVSLGIDPDFYKTKDLHIHVPEGAIPKDGPSAGVTMVTAIASALSGLPVRRDIAMTGEVTLRGRVLAIGGLREKTMAAYSAGVTTVLIPEPNLPDLEEIDPVVREALTFIPCKTADDVLNHALVRPEVSELMVTAPAVAAPISTQIGGSYAN